jgi:hypothetical protein
MNIIKKIFCKHSYKNISKKFARRCIKCGKYQMSVTSFESGIVYWRTKWLK